MPFTVFNETLGIKRAAHLLRRVTFGADKSQIETFASLTPAEAVSRLFDNELPEPQLPVDPLSGEEWISNAESEENELQEYFKRWFIGQMLSIGVSPELSLSYAAREKIVLFLHTHFTTKQSVVNNSRALYYQNELFRRFATDDNVDDPDLNFRELTKKICVDNAMLSFLDGRLNVKGNPNENFARELFELYTIGRGLEGTLPEISEQGDYFNFTEEDVQAAARVLSGFNTDHSFTTLDEITGLPRGRARGGDSASQHDMDIKQFSHRFDMRTIQPSSELMTDPEITNEMIALDEISQLIDMIFEKEETARHICREIYRFYVYHEITTDIEQTVIHDMADIFITNNYKIRPVLRALLSSTHFFDADAGVSDNNYGGIIKSPLDLILGTILFFKIPIPDHQEEPGPFYEITGQLLRSMSSQGLDFYEPFEVAGYSAYHQFPAYNRNWISTNYLTRRYDFIQGLMEEQNMEMPDTMMPGIDPIQFIRNNFPAAIAENAESLIRELALFLLPVSDNLTFNEPDDNAEITSERLRYFKFAFLYSPQIDENPEEAWTFRWNTPVDDEVVNNQLKNLLNAMLQSPEYQLM